MPSVYISVVPISVIFFWVRVNVQGHKLFQEGVEDGKGEQLSIMDVEDTVFDAAVKKGVLVAKGRMFRAEADDEVADDVTTNSDVDGHTNGVTGREMPHCFFRMTFAACGAGEMEEAVRRFGEAVRAEFGTE